MTNLNLHPDLREEPFDAEAAAFDEFVGRLEADGREWEKRLIEECLAFGRGDLFEAIGRDDWIFTLNGDHGVWLTDAQAAEVCGFTPHYLKAQSPKGGFLTRGLLGPLDGHQPSEHRYDLMDVVAYQKSADIAATYGVERDVTAEKKLSAYIIRDSLNEWLADDDNVRKLMEVIYG